MQKCDLILHCGGKVVEREELNEIVLPDATRTWCPIAHHDLLDQVTDTMQRSGLQIVQQVHGISRDGDRYFGMLQVTNGQNPEDYSMIVGVRNSHDQSFPAALALGACVFVCDNLSFSGEVKLARKHTRHIMRDLPGLVERGIGQLGEHRLKQDERIVAYKDHELTDTQAHDVLINALDCRVITPRAIPNVLCEWRHPKHDEFKPRTAWSLFNAFTENFKGNATRSLPQTQKLHGLMDSTCGLIATA